MQLHKIKDMKKVLFLLVMSELGDTGEKSRFGQKICCSLLRVEQSDH
jgi:hypothetical protein